MVEFTAVADYTGLVCEENEYTRLVHEDMVTNTCTAEGDGFPPEEDKDPIGRVPVGLAVALAGGAAEVGAVLLLEVLDDRTQ